MAGLNEGPVRSGINLDLDQKTLTYYQKALLLPMYMALGKSSI